MSFAEREDYGQLARRISSLFDCTSFPIRRPTDRRDSGDLPLIHEDPVLHDAAAADVSRSSSFALPQASPAIAMPSTFAPPSLGAASIRPRPSSSPAGEAAAPQRRPKSRGPTIARQVRSRTM